MDVVVHNYSKEGRDQLKCHKEKFTSVDREDTSRCPYILHYVLDLFLGLNQSVFFFLSEC